MLQLQQQQKRSNNTAPLQLRAKIVLRVQEIHVTLSAAKATLEPPFHSALLCPAPLRSRAPARALRSKAIIYGGAVRTQKPARPLQKAERIGR
ncbi:GD18881 [Drosophila simulans]|uniref:GD18881 n=1 Tax=Drosophila simulans TaxID=7240 RepID=B4R1W5_DROSI|nr:GD18881 [Drosophila simulans]